MTHQPGATEARMDRVIRVFVSSTFKDMHDEREELIKRIFPKLRKLCESRGVVWSEVDLRWGIPDEAKAEGKVLPICLAEIHRCRPYFIGLLGERYGWVPEEIPQELIVREPWLKEHLHRSVTELEILHGVLNNPEMSDQAFFYLRDPAYADSQPPADRANLREGPTAEEVKELGEKGAELRAEDRRTKLAALKERLRQSGLSLEENYLDPKDLGQLVLWDLTAVIDCLFPEGSQPNPLDREAAAHEAYARSRAVVEVRPGEFSGVYIGRNEYLKRLDIHAQEDGPPLVVLGKSGMGKSALLANWALGFRPRHPQDHLIMHFIGAGPYSADWAAMLRRIMEELQRQLNIQEEIPEQPDALRLAFANFLSMAAAKGRVVLIIDALNQLEDRDGAPDLVWLPPVIPANIRLILSTLPGRPLEDLKNRGWPTLTVQPLEPGERRQLILAYLAQYTKELSPPELERLAAAPPTANPLYLRALLEELRVYGDHYTLKARLDQYLTAPGVKELYELILARYEGDYEEDQPGLVGEALSLLSAARRGLSQAELLDLLGKEGEPMPGAVWSPLFLAAEHALMDRSGLINFGHDYFRQAVWDRYIATETRRLAAHLRLVDYFDEQDLEIGGRPNLRKIDELPWQLARAGAWERLQGLLVAPAFFRQAWNNDQFEVKACWAQMEDNSPLRLAAAYRGVLDDPAQHQAIYVWNVAMLLKDTGHPEEALALQTHLVEHFRRSGDRKNLSVCLSNRALILKDRGDLDGAMALHKEVERLCRELGSMDGLQASLGNRALILKDRGDLDGAMALVKEQERLCRELGNKDGLQASLGNQALILSDRGDLDEAMALHKEVERLCRELGNKDGLQITLGNQANILYARGDLDGAMALMKDQERLCRELGHKDGLQRNLGNQANILYARGDLDGAMALHKEEERLCRELGKKDGLQASLGNQALILYARGDLNGAMALHKEEECLCRELGNKDGLQRSLGNQANILYARGDLDGAMALYNEQERLCRELGNKDGLQRSLGNQALILSDRGDLNGAMAQFKEQERLCLELGNKEGLAISLVNQAVLLSEKMNRPQEAQPLAEEAYCLAESHGYAALAGQIKPILDRVRSKKGWGKKFLYWLRSQLS